MEPHETDSPPTAKDPTEGRTAQTATTAPHDDRHAMLSRLSRLMFFRVMLVTVLMIGMVLSNYLMGTPWRLGHPSAQFLIGTILFQFAISICYGLITQWISNLTLFFYVQLLVDLVAISIVVHVTGGAASGFAALYIVAVVAGSMVDYKRGTLVAALGSIVFFLAVSLAGYVKLLPTLTGQRLPPWEMMLEDLFKNLAVNVAALGAVALLSSYLAEQLSRAGKRAKAHQQAYLDLSAHHEDILTRLDSGIISTDANERILTINQAAVKICSVRKEQVVGQTLESVLPQLSGLSGSKRLTFPDGSGDTVSVEVTVTRMETSERVHQGRVLLLQNRTEFERMEEEVKRTERLAMLGRFTAALAHEIRNPLASISGSIELLRNTAVQNGEDAKLMDIVVKEVDRLDSLIGEMLDFSRPSQFRPETVDLPELARDATRLFVKERHVSDTQVDVVTEDQVFAHADPSKIRQVLWNLLRNAADATLHRTPIQVVVGRRSRMAAIKVIDRGQGISPVCVDRIFEPFFTTKEKGTGLGLAAVHQIVEEHGGRINVRSTEGRGTTVEILLPLDHSRHPVPDPSEPVQS